MNTEKVTVSKIKNVFFVYSRRGEHNAIKNRPFYGLSFCESGCIVYHYKGKEVVSDTSHGILIPMGADYTIERKENGCFPVINFLCATPLPKEFLSFPIANSVYYCDLCRQIKEALSKGERCHAMGLLYELFHRLNREKENDNPLKPVLDFMEEHLGEKELNNTLLAQAGNISEVYLCKQFRRFYGQSPHAYLIKLRLEKAKNLLEQTDCSVGEIADRCGYPTVYHFCRYFKKINGRTPREYREYTRLNSANYE